MYKLRYPSLKRYLRICNYQNCMGSALSLPLSYRNISILFTYPLLEEMRFKVQLIHSDTGCITLLEAFCLDTAEPKYLFKTF